jgi:PKD repeat protein
VNSLVVRCKKISAVIPFAVLLIVAMQAMGTGVMDDQTSMSVNNIETSATWNAPEVLSTTTTNTAWRPVMVDDSQGNVFVAWVDTSGLDGGGTDADICFRWLNVTSMEWSAVEVISNGSEGVSECPALAIDQLGNVHVAWEDNSSILSSGTDYDILYRVRNATTGTWSNTELVSSESTLDSGHPTIVVDASGNVHVAWDDLTNCAGHNDNKVDVFYKVRNATTYTWENATIVSSDSMTDALEPSICIDPFSTIHIAYIRREGAMRTAIAYRSKLVNSTSWSAIFKIQNFGYLNGEEHFNPIILVDTIGNLHVVFYRYGWDLSGFSGYSLCIKSYLFQASSWLPEGWVYGDIFTSYSGCNIGYSADLDDSGNLHLAFAVNNTIKYCWLNSTTRSWSSPTPIAASPQGSTKRPSITADGFENLFLAWDNNTSTTGTETSSIFFTTTSSYPASLVADFAANSTTIDEWGSVQFYYQGSGGDIPLSFQWNFGDASQNSTEQHPTHQFSRDGIYTITLTVVDDDGSAATCQKACYITVLNVVTTVSIAVNAKTILVGQSVTFNCTWTGGNGPFTVSWPGASDLHSMVVTLTFTIPGYYTVNCTVVDADGDVATAQVNLMVLSNEGETGPTPQAPWNINLTITIALGFCFTVVGFAFTGKSIKARKRTRNPDF